MDCFEILNINETKDTKEIRRAYSKLLTKYSPEVDPEGFQRLRGAYEEALLKAKEDESLSKKQLSPLDKFMKEFEEIYKCFQKRVDSQCWTELLEKDICYNIDTSGKVSDRILRFIMEYYNFPHEIWQLFDSYFSWSVKKDKLYNDFPKNFIDFVIYKINNKSTFRYKYLRECKGDDGDKFITEYNKIYNAIEDFDLYTANNSIKVAEKFCPTHPDLLILIGRYLTINGKMEEAIKLFTDIISNDKEDLDAYFYRGDLYYRIGNLKEAYNDYKMVLHIKPDFFGALYGLGKCCIILQKYEEAIEHLEKLCELVQYRQDIKIILNSTYNFYTDSLLEAIEEDTTNNNLKYKLAEIYFKTNKTEESYNILSELMQSTNVTSEIYSLFCQVLRDLKNIELAYSTVCKAVDLFNDDYKLNFLKADILDELGKYEEAIEQYDKILTLKEEEASVHNNKSYIYNILNRHNEALECAHRAISIDSNMAHAYKNKAAALLELGLYENCLEACEQALNIYQYLTEVYIIKMKAFINIKLYDEALRVYDNASDLGLRDSKLYYEKAIVLIILDRFEEAINYCDRAMEIEPNNSDFIYRKGLCYYYKEDYGQAIEWFDNAIKLNSSYGGSYYYKTLSLMYSSMEKQALDVIDEAINLNIEHPDSFYDLKGLIMRKENNYEEAVVQYRKAISYEPAVGQYYYLLADSLSELGKFEEAIEYFKKAIDIDPNQEDWYVDMSYSLYNLNKYNECIKYCNKAIDINDECVIAHQNKGWAFFKLGNIKKAEEECTTALKLDGNNSGVLLLKLRILQYKKLYQDALIVCDRMLELDEDDEKVKGIRQDLLKEINKSKSEKKGFFGSLFK
ncbi:tetratricopeptide (TPR) repeat protein [Clostridium tetanomorphum]|uniref:Tetratricopeptide repeat protein n=1 Tax=Clostridium tetanomorphum TaxID=1553 RepID=A0A923ECP5_CLOTT|nr:tetratricopeptide repeat protein [Clostridium tetanomorphum]KAJ51925.1 tetratricopeptide repeat protein,DnaJ-like protein [Clostridium tetanomorphum DSM 665]MBC2398654.1 tetratricopeptide repeat protein [Clostridium tetanomorphum]MBP1864067.1 tetratricopeptide (TPR) repeat protein [Clostridium tetanomorphum]NRS84480.1 tetratricopeptide (TPR) repeat protein [Clostridium tetanomorphum]NRZ97694.1 tetratricopeptide (TPR) repeat protein [Clostridium tetanomorphum]